MGLSNKSLRYVISAFPLFNFFSQNVSLRRRLGAEQPRTDLVSAGVEEVAQAHDVAVVQLSHDLQLAVLQAKEEEEREKTDSRLAVAFGIHRRQS